MKKTNALSQGAETYVVHSTHGDFEIDEEGKPLNPDEIKEALGFVITRFDLPEYRRTYGVLDDEFDILDLGYWYKRGEDMSYEPPEPDFRKEVAKNA